MRDFPKGKIYMLRNSINDELYVGSTVSTLSTRLIKHKSESTHARNGMPIMKAMRELGSENFSIELIEDFPCTNACDLHKREGYWIRHYNTYGSGYNALISGRDKKEWTKEHAEHVAEQKKNWQKDNAEHVAEHKKHWAEQNRDKVNLRCKEYYARIKNNKCVCECGVSIHERHKAKHQETPTHLKRMQSLATNEG